jgi:hypothetical protein
MRCTSFSVVNVASRAGMLESIKNNDIRQHLIGPTATIESVSDILSDFIRYNIDCRIDNGHCRTCDVCIPI